MTSLLRSKQGLLRLKNRSFFLITLVLIAGCASSQSKKEKELTQTERAQALLQIANGALKEGDPTGALQSLIEAEKLAPNSAEVYHSKALAYYFKRDLPTALRAAEKAVQLDGKYSVALNTLGKLHLDLDQLDKAEPYLQRAAKDPLNREAYKARTNLGILYYRKKEVSKAQEQFDLAIQEAPNLACVAHYYRGHIWLKEAKNELAIRDYKEATKNYCGAFADAHLALGIAYQRNSDIDGAKKKFLEIQNLYPNTKTASRAMDYLRKLP